MKHFFAFCKRNRLFAALLAVELAVLCVLAAGLFGAPYKLTMTPDLFENPFPDIASNEGITSRCGTRRTSRPVTRWISLLPGRRCDPARMR